MKHIIKLTNAEENFKKEKVRTQNKLPRKFSILQTEAKDEKPGSSRSPPSKKRRYSEGGSYNLGQVERNVPEKPISEMSQPKRSEKIFVGKNILPQNIDETFQ